MSKIINLTVEEIGLGARAGLKQFNKKFYRSKGSKNRLENHVTGKLGEIAYCKFTGHKINLEHYEHCGDGGIDAEDGSQIKTVMWTGPNKQIKISKSDHDAALKNNSLKNYVLAAMDPSNGGEIIEIIGYISKENFNKKYHTEEKWGDGLLVVDEDQLDFYYEK